MLIEFYGRNFGCFRDEFRLSMLATDIDPESDRGVANVKVEGDEEPLRLLRAVALYGPNASGKSTLIRAAGSLRHLLTVTPRLSSDALLPFYEPFALGPQSRQSVVLGAKAVIDGQVYDYNIAFKHEAFASERLVRILPDGTIETLIDRDGQKVTGVWTEESQFQLVSREFRPNALLLSLADSLAPGVAKQIAVALRRLLKHSDPSSNPIPGFFSTTAVAERMRHDKAFGHWLLARLQMADIGVVDVQHEEIKPGAEKNALEFLESRLIVEEDSTTGEPPRGRRRTPYRLTFLHESESHAVALPYERESLGTKRFVEWAPLVYDLTHADKPRAAFVDEFDASMHPVLLRALVEHFNCEPPADEARGQLVFTTHETALLDDEARNAALRRDQVYLTEKDAAGASRLYSVAEFRERNNLNMRRRYLQGRYGALPSLGTFTER